MRVPAQFRSSPAVHAATLRGEAMPPFAATTAALIPGLLIDPAFTPVQVPTPQGRRAGGQPLPVLARGQLLDGPRAGDLPGQGQPARRPGRPAGRPGRGHRSPAEHLHTILVDEAAAARDAGHELVENVYANPRVEPLGPPEEDQSS